MSDSCQSSDRVRGYPDLVLDHAHPWSQETGTHSVSINNPNTPNNPFGGVSGEKILTRHSVQRRKTSSLRFILITHIGLRYFNDLWKLFPHVGPTIFSINCYNLTTLCLNGTLPCVDFMDVIMGDIPLFPHVNTAYTIFSIKLLYIT